MSNFCLKFHNKNLEEIIWILPNKDTVMNSVTIQNLIFKNKELTKKNKQASFMRIVKSWSLLWHNFNNQKPSYLRKIYVIFIMCQHFRDTVGWMQYKSCSALSLSHWIILEKWPCCVRCCRRSSTSITHRRVVSKQRHLVIKWWNHKRLL